MTELDLERQIPALRRFAWSLTGSRDDADDLVQDCLERALAHGRSYRAEAAPRAWLFSILYNLFVSGRRPAARRPHAPLEEAPEIGEDGGQEQRVAYLEILAALDQLPQDQRAVVVLVGVEDFTYEEAAQTLDVPIGTVMSRLSRGRECLRRLLAGENGAAARPLGVVR